MPAAADLLTRAAGEIARLIHTGEVSSREVVEASFERIDEANPEVNAFIALDHDRALAAAAEVGPGDARPFAGVPIAIKDLRAVDGLPLSFGTELWGDFVPDFDAHVVGRLKGAGFVVVGITNMPEIGVLPVTEPRRYGPTRNPWDLDRTPGGSSGGSAAAVASGMVPVAHATDGGGSTRIPGACCGLVGLKPARGRISAGPLLGESLLNTDGVLTRTVADTAAMLDVLAGYLTGDASWAPPPEEPFAASAAREPGALRIAMTIAPPIEAPVDPVCAGAAHQAAELLTELGHEVEEVPDPPWTLPGLLQLFSPVFGASLSGAIVQGGVVAGREPGPQDVEALTWAMYERARSINAVEYSAVVTRLHVFARSIVQWLSPYDAVLTPALAERPLPIGTLPADVPDPWATFTRSGQFTPFTAIANTTGLPAISLPLFHGEDGLPLAVQLIGRPAGEAQLLSLAAQIESARPWADRLAPGARPR